MAMAENFEKHADLEHEDGTVTLSADRVKRWKRQMNTLYSDLPEEEKNGDRVQVRKHQTLDLLGTIDRSAGTGRK